MSQKAKRAASGQITKDDASDDDEAGGDTAGLSNISSYSPDFSCDFPGVTKNSTISFSS